MPRRPATTGSVVRALEEARYGPHGLLNLRDSMPTGHEARTRAESWLRERQVMGVREAMIITGRGKGSPGGEPVVREEVRKLFGSLKRRGVIDGFQEHGEGSFLVTVAPLKRLFGAARRKRDASPPDSAVRTTRVAKELSGLERESRDLLRRLAEVSLESLGISSSDEFLESEMLRQFSLIAGSLPTDADRDASLRSALVRAIREYEDA